MAPGKLIMPWHKVLGVAKTSGSPLTALRAVGALFPRMTQRPHGSTRRIPIPNP